jgi:hypothetical protein
VGFLPAGGGGGGVTHSAYESIHEAALYYGADIGAACDGWSRDEFTLPSTPWECALRVATPAAPAPVGGKTIGTAIGTFFTNIPTIGWVVLGIAGGALLGGGIRGGRR